MKLPRFIASTPPPRETGLARAQDIGALTRTGGAEFGALTQLGGAIKGSADLGFQAWQNRRALDDQQKIGEINQKAEESDRLGVGEISQIDLSADRPLPDNPDYFKGNKTLNSQMWDKDTKVVESDHRKRITSLATAIKDPRTRQKWINQQLSQSNIDAVKRAKYNEYQKSTFLDYAKTAAANGDMEISDKWIDIAERHGLITHGKALAEKSDNSKLSVREEVRGLYRIEAYDEARKALESSSLSNEDKEKLDDEIDTDERMALVKFEDSVNDEFIRIDNTPNMTQAGFNEQSRLLKEKITTANVPGKRKRQLLVGLEKWRRGTNEIDYARMLSLNQEMDAAQRSGIVDPTIENRITRANIEGAFGGRHRGGQKTYSSMIRRFGKLQFDERLQAISPIVRAFERANVNIDPRIVFLFHEAKNKFIAEHPDIDTKELFIKINGLAESYDILPESEIVERLKRSSRTIVMTAPDGEKFVVPLNKKQKFLDNGYTE